MPWAIVLPLSRACSYFGVDRVCGCCNLSLLVVLLGGSSSIDLGIPPVSLFFCVVGYRLEATRGGVFSLVVTVTVP